MKEQVLINRIIRAERKLDELKSEYITLYGYCGLKMNPDGTVSEIGDSK